MLAIRTRSPCTTNSACTSPWIAMQKVAVRRGNPPSKTRWNMTWLQRFRLRHYLRNSLWVYPVLALVAGLLLARVLIRLETESGWVGTMDPDSVRAVLGTLAGS